ncbi:MAG: hypothetical protein L3K06_03580, partial [Thermoplasmata archaeon]|nr:hypothetical protein [Thermoplasmata archaeon]
LGFGFEWLEGSWGSSRTTGSPPLGGLNITNFRDAGGGSGLSGWEFVNLQAGLDVRPGAWWGLGPFLMLSFGQFDRFSAPSRSLSIDQTSLHEWFLLGVRGIFDPMSFSPSPSSKAHPE